jgi:hypothetical protein
MRRRGSENEPKLRLGAVAREALSAYRGNFALLIGTALVVFVPVGFLEALTHDLQNVELGDGTAALEVVSAAVLVTLTATLGEVFYAGLVAAVAGRHRDPTSNLRHRASEVAAILRRLPVLRLLAIDLLFVAVVVGGFIALIVPGVIFFTWFVLAAPVAEIEDLRIRTAFSRSRGLVRGSFWRVLAILVPVMIVGDQFGAWLLDSGPWVLGDGFLGDWLGAVLSEGLTAPFFALAAVVTTHHLIELRG